ncbi:hypothetical protein V6N12_016779 [Hibiscus sabdariffa]|uniref:Pentatricopeptide repeat-containing protein n=1 Tax=Hibiscus sabdariffa TaxID=183260 RepID=A0ABR2CFF7_9ROSI
MILEGTRPDSSTFTMAIKVCVSLMDLEMGEEIWRNALELLIEMQGCGFKPDSVSLVVFDQIVSRDIISWNAMIASYGVHGHGKEALSLVCQMTNMSLKPDHATFAALLSALSHSGLVNEEEAYKLIRSLNKEPGAAVWVALLSGCRNHGKLSIGEMAAKKVLELNPDDLGIHAKGNTWDEVAAVRKLMKDSGKKKVPGYSVLDVNGKLHLVLE